MDLSRSVTKIPSWSKSKLLVNGIWLLVLMMTTIYKNGARTEEVTDTPRRFPCNQSHTMFNLPIVNETDLVSSLIVEEATVNSSSVEIINGSKIEKQNGTNELSKNRSITIVSTNVKDVDFLFYGDPSNLNKYQKIEFKQKDSLERSGFQQNRPIKVLIHGFTQGKSTEFPKDMKNAYLNCNSDKVNVVVIDWGKLAAHPSSSLSFFYYATAVANVYRVGNHVADFLIFLREVGALENFGDVHIVGFSLGAHVAAVIGQRMLELSHDKIGRITGLDPAGPSFSLLPNNKILDSSDASFVDVIHTNTRLLGYAQQLGHVDFYPNGGQVQKYCGKDLYGICSHSYSHKFYTRSIIDPTALMACKCDSWLYFDKKNCNSIPAGEPCPTSTRGSYYLDP